MIRRADRALVDNASPVRHRRFAFKHRDVNRGGNAAQQ
jgi:hypothetical protein